ncbi:MAG: glycosyltransferase family 39 protein [Myxococcales bacterium]|nr:glycosyltransferase family 39 protein [Myxococcales bacterium]
MSEASSRGQGRWGRWLSQLHSPVPLPKGTPFEQRLITMGALLIFAAGLAFRLFYGHRIRETFGLIGNRFGQATGIANNLLENGFYSIDGIHPNVTEEPVYPVVVAFSQWLPGAPWLSYLLVQIGVAAVGAWAVYRLCVLCGTHRPHALLTAALFFTHPYLASQSVAIADTQLFASVLILTVCSWLTLQEHNNVRAALGAGSCLALCFLTRNTTLVVLPAIAVFFLATMWAEGWQGWQNRVRNVALACSITLVLVTPWCIRIWQLTDHFMVATHGTMEFHAGNNSHIYKRLADNLSVDGMELDPGLKLWKLAESRYQPRSPRFTVYLENLHRSKGVDWVIEHPDEFIAMVPLRLFRMWSWNLNPKFDRYGKLNPNYELKASILRVFYIPVTLLAGFAFCVPVLWNRGTVFCAGILIFFSCAAALLFGFTRLRTPFDIFLIIPAVQGALWLSTRLRERWGS